MPVDSRNHPVVQPVPEGLPRPPNAEPIGQAARKAGETLSEDTAPGTEPGPDLNTAQEWAHKPLADVLGEKPSPDQ